MTNKSSITSIKHVAQFSEMGQKIFLVNLFFQVSIIMKTCMIQKEVVIFFSFVVIHIIIRTFLQRYYFSSAKELMRINGTTKSFVANHLAESIAGAMSIRAFEEEDRFFRKNLEHINKNASPFFHSFAANEWLIQRLETLSATVLASAALCIVLLPPGTFSSGEQNALFYLSFLPITRLIVDI